MIVIPRSTTFMLATLGLAEEVCWGDTTDCLDMIESLKKFHWEQGSCSSSGNGGSNGQQQEEEQEEEEEEEGKKKKRNEKENERKVKIKKK